MGFMIGVVIGVLIILIAFLFVVGVLRIMRASLLWFWRVDDIVRLLESIDRRLEKLSVGGGAVLAASVAKNELTPKPLSIAGACNFCGSGKADGTYQGHPICRACASSF